MVWWLFWSEVMQHCLAPRPLRSQNAVAGRASGHAAARRRPPRAVAARPVQVAAQRRPALRLVCVDGVRIDRAAY